MKCFARVKPYLYILAVVVIIAIAWLLRWHAATVVKVDYLVLIMSAPVVAIFLLMQRTLLERMMFGEAR